MAITRKLESVLRSIENDFTDVRNDFLKGMAEELVRLTATLEDGGPAIDTGAYVSSHSITTTKGSGRSRTSRHKPKGVNPQVAASASLNALYNDIDNISPDTTTVYMNNNSPHAQAVEHGVPGVWKRGGYYIYTRTRREAGNILSKAVAKNKR